MALTDAAVATSGPEPSFLVGREGDIIGADAGDMVHWNHDKRAG